MNVSLPLAAAGRLPSQIDSGFVELHHTDTERTETELDGITWRHRWRRTPLLCRGRPG